MPPEQATDAIRLPVDKAYISSGPGAEAEDEDELGRRTSDDIDGDVQAGMGGGRGVFFGDTVMVALAIAVVLEVVSSPERVTV